MGHDRQSGPHERRGAHQDRSDAGRAPEEDKNSPGADKELHHLLLPPLRLPGPQSRVQLTPLQHTPPTRPPHITLLLTSVRDYDIKSGDKTLLYVRVRWM